MANFRSSNESEKHRVWGVRSMLIGPGDGSGLIDRKDRCLDIVVVSVFSRGREVFTLFDENSER